MALFDFKFEKKNGPNKITKERSAELKEFLAGFKVRFKNAALLNQSLIHSSYPNETGQQIEDNQRLEYLGDSVLGLIVNEYLYLQFPDRKEGELARIKSAVVSESALAEIAAEIKLGDHLLLGKGESRSGGRARASNLADALEALIGAVYLDQGLEKTSVFVVRLMEKKILSYENPGTRDAKSALQELSQKKFKIRPEYEVVETTGPEHNRQFVCKVVVGGKEAGRGSGISRKQAEQKAARAALNRLEK